MTVAAAAASTPIMLLFWVCCDHGCHGHGCGCGCHGCCRCCGVAAAVDAAAACMYQYLPVYVSLCTYMRVNACASAYVAMLLIILARSHTPHCLCVAKRRAWQHFVQLIGRNADMRNAWLLCRARVLRLASPKRSAQ